MSNSWFKKEKPLMGLLGTGGGAATGSATAVPFEIRYFITAGGGGGGGGQGGGGGGAGGIRLVADATPYVSIDTAYPLLLGARGDGAGPNATGADGGNSHFTAPTVNVGGGGGGGASNSDPDKTGRNAIQIGGSGGGGGNDGASSPDPSGYGPGGNGYDFPGQPEINKRGPGGPFYATSGGTGYSGPGTYNGNRGGGGGGCATPGPGDGKPGNNGTGPQPANPTGRPGGPGGNGITVPLDYLPDAWTGATPPQGVFSPPDPSPYRGGSPWTGSHGWGYWFGVATSEPSTYRRNFGGGGGGGTEKASVLGGWAPGPMGASYRGAIGAGGGNAGGGNPAGGYWGYAGGGGGGSGPPTNKLGSDGGGGAVVFKIPSSHTATSPIINDPGNQIWPITGEDYKLIILFNDTTSDVSSTITFTEA